MLELENRNICSFQLVNVMEPQTKRQRVLKLASSLFSCKNDECRQVCGVTTKTSKDGLYRMNVQCISCNQSWVVCISCQRRFNGTKVYLANRHFDEAHSTNSQSLSKLSTDASSVAFSSESNFEESDSNVIIKQCLKESSMEVKSRLFFQNKAISLPHAIQNLVAQAFS